VTTFDILSSAWSTCSTKGPVMTAKQTPWMHHWFLWDLHVTNMFQLNEVVWTKHLQKNWKYYESSNQKEIYY